MKTFFLEDSNIVFILYNVIENDGPENSLID